MKSNFKIRMTKQGHVSNIIYDIEFADKSNKFNCYYNMIRKNITQYKRFDYDDILRFTNIVKIINKKTLFYEK
jgi:hypothetical protein